MHFNDLRKLKRFKDIVSILAKYGFDDIVTRLDVPGSDLLRKIRPVTNDMETYERIRAVVEDLGATFIKFGQIMSLRPDMLPANILKELEKLQDDVPPADFNEIEVLIEQEIGSPIQQIFSTFEITPMAAASISQVHKATLRHEQKAVAVKAQRPGIEKNIKLDLDILEGIADFLDQQFEDLRTYELPDLVRIIRKNMMKEVDFTKELRSMDIARSNATDQDFYVPQTYEKYSSDKVLIMELINGTKLKDLQTTSGYDKEKIAMMGLRAGVKQILEDGFFHADPHPGNMLVRKDMTLCLIDWGLVGRLTEKDRFQLIELLQAIVEKNSDSLVRCFLRLCDARGEHVQSTQLERELLEMLDDYHAIPIKDMNIGSFLMSMTELMRKHRLRLPTDLSVMIKAQVTAEGSARLIYPDLDVISEIKEYVQTLAAKRYTPEVMWRSMRNSIAGLWFSQRQIPHQIGMVISKLEQGKLGFSLHLEKLEQLVDTLDNASNRLTAGIITGAIIIGSSMIITTGVGPFLFGFPALGVIGYLVSVVIGLWLIFTIFKGKKK
ncbi:MAG: ABC1 kinase family protein [Desulfopila sp.]